MLTKGVLESDLVAESDCDGASARIVFALSLVESTSSWSRFLCARQRTTNPSGGRKSGVIRANRREIDAGEEDEDAAPGG